MTIVERALELVADQMLIGLGSGRAAQSFIRALGAQVSSGAKRVRGVPTSEETAALAQSVGIPLSTLAETGPLDITVDGADEVDPNLDLIKGYGRALVREKIVAASSRRLVILVGKEKLVQQLGTRGKLPIEVVPFALPLCQELLQDELGCRPTPVTKDGSIFMSDNGNYILECAVKPIADPVRLECALLAIPGIVGTGLFLGAADVVLVGNSEDFQLIEERHRRPEERDLGAKSFLEPTA
jgi:ribose 5-phosphate isomerase A